LSNRNNNNPEDKNGYYQSEEINLKFIIMRKVGTLVGLLLLLLIISNGCQNVKHDSGSMKDSREMRRMRIGKEFRHNRRMPYMGGGIGQGMGNGMMRGMGPGMRHEMMRGMGPGMRYGMMRGMDSRMGFGMMRGMGRMPLDSIGWIPMGQGRRILESIPNVTEKQKSQIEDLIKKQQDEMKKLREEMTAKMKSMMASHRKDILNILTDEQKKFIKSGEVKPG